MTTRPYIIKKYLPSGDCERLAIVTASSPAQAERIYADTLFMAEASSASEILQAMRDGVPVIEAQT